jgi:hypothetical protein
MGFLDWRDGGRGLGWVGSRGRVGKGSYESTLLGGFGVGDAGSKGNGAHDESRRQWRGSLFFF